MRKALLSGGLEKHQELGALAGSQIPQPHLEDSSVYRQNRPTCLDSNWQKPLPDSKNIT